MAKFDITAAFAAAVGNVSDSDTSREASSTSAWTNWRLTRAIFTA